MTSGGWGWGWWWAGGLELRDTVKQGVSINTHTGSLACLMKTASEHFTASFQRGPKVFKLFIDPKSAVSDARSLTPPLCFAVCLSSSAGPFFKLKHGPVLFGIACYWHSLSPSAQTLPLSTLLPVRQSERDGEETMRILIPIHTSHCIGTKPRTDSGSASPRIATMFWICGAKWGVGSLIPISPIISRV